MIFGNGQLANCFKSDDVNDVIIFASGVSNSNCTDQREFLREESLLRAALEYSTGGKFVYFSSCALTAGDSYANSPYYNHKKNMESLIRSYSDNFYIFRLPQLFGSLFTHKTIINYFYNAINENSHFQVFNDAYRYVIHIDDVKVLVLSYLTQPSKICVDLANPYRYSVLTIINILEQVLGKKASYDIVSKTDKYEIDLSDLKKFMNLKNLELGFGESYFREKIELCL